MNNRMHNATNPNQGKFPRVLALCSAGLLRAPTIARVLAETYNLNTRAAGLGLSFALIPVDKVLLAWAQEIVVVEKEMVQELVVRYLVDPSIITCLDIPDEYKYMDNGLVAMIKRRYSRRGKFAPSTSSELESEET